MKQTGSMNKETLTEANIEVFKQKDSTVGAAWVRTEQMLEKDIILR